MIVTNALVRNIPPRTIEYLSPPASVSMADPWFDIATVNHFWIKRRFKVLNRLADDLLKSSNEMAEIGCGHGLLQRQIEQEYRRDVTGFDLNEYALKRNVSQESRVCCYDIFQLNPAFRNRFDVVFLFDVLEHISDEDSFLKAALFHLSSQGNLVLNVPAGQWVYSVYDKAVGHLRRYSIPTLRKAIANSGLRIAAWTYWGLPLVPTLMMRKLWLMGEQDEVEIISKGMDSRSPALDRVLGLVSGCELIPQKLLGSSLMAVLCRGEL